MQGSKRKKILEQTSTLISKDRTNTQLSWKQTGLPGGALGLLGMGGGHLRES
jgi:hypothetical protein